jgi:trehalose 6-phosphate phosphatase
MKARKDTHARLDAVLFDMDGVITDTAMAHVAAWKKLFDEHLRDRLGEDFQPFDEDEDYREYVDGKPRYDGVRSFLQSRGIDLPFGSETDSPDEETVCGLGNRKNGYFNSWLENNAAEAYPGTLALMDTLRKSQIPMGVFSSSRNATAVLTSAGVLECFDVKVDGSDMAQLGLPGKPDPAIMLQAARALDVAAERTAVIEDALAGVRAGAAGGFAQVIGVDRDGDGQKLARAGADMVVADLGELELDPARGLVVRTIATTPSFWESIEQVRARLAGRRPVVFLDYDGSLTPIVEDPRDAVLGDDMRAALLRLAERATVAIVSGRDLEDVRGLVADDSLYYAGSHGFDLAGPDGWREVVEKGREFLPALEEAAEALAVAIKDVKGARVERKRFSIAVHFRQVADEEVDCLTTSIDEVMKNHARLRASAGKKVIDIKPRTDWHKGRAVQCLLGVLAPERRSILPIYAGDDTTDEDAFRALSHDGIGIVVRDEENRRTAAAYALDGVDEVQRFLDWLAGEMETRHGR